MTEEKEDKTIIVNADTRSWIEKVVQAFSKQEKLTDKMKTALTEGGNGCQNGDRGDIIQAITKQHTEEKGQNNRLVLAILTISIFGTTLITFFFNWLNHLIGI